MSGPRETLVESDSHFESTQRSESSALRQLVVQVLFCATAAAALVVGAPTITEWFQNKNEKPETLAMTAEPTQRVVVDGDMMYLEGLVPDQEISDSLESIAVAAVGRERVVNNFEISSQASYNAAAPLQLNLADPVLFDTGTATLDEQYEPLIEIAVELMKADLTSTLSIVGHTDDIGAPDANVTLSLERAESVGGLFLEQGIDPNRILVDGRGEADPLESNETEQGRAINRRVDVSILGVFGS